MTSAALRQTINRWRAIAYVLAPSPLPDRGSPLTRLRSALDALGAPQVDGFMWRVEGLGRSAALQLIEAAPEDPLLRLIASRLPSHALPMLHAGMGMALATTALDCRSDPVATAKAVVAACRFHSADGYEGCALESFGLATATFLSGEVRAMDAALVSTGTGAETFFWHGVGRGWFFDPADVWVRDDWAERAAARTMRVAPRTRAVEDAVAGVAWALTLTNWRDRDLIDGAIRAPALQSRAVAVASGMNAASVVRSISADEGSRAPHRRDVQDWFRFVN